MSVTSFDQLNLSKYYTYQDYLAWTFPERVELFLGKVFRMSPAPSITHQRISTNLVRNIANFLDSKPCSVFHAPCDVRLPVSLREGQSDTVLQPDILVVCDVAKLDEQGCNGAPDMVVEILSTGNSKREMKDKFDLYESSLVPEYWIVDPVHQDVTLYTLDAENKYIGSRPYLEGDSISSIILPELRLDVGEIFKK
ncbi:MAG: Uma2 family endonuclease [Saprospiraceae bacterium]|jgi:Uma2 family endonuclease